YLGICCSYCRFKPLQAEKTASPKTLLSSRPPIRRLQFTVEESGGHHTTFSSMARWSFFQPPSDEEREHTEDEEGGEVEEEPQHKLRRRRLEQEKQEEEAEEENDDSSGSADDEEEEDDELQEEEEEDDEEGDDKPSIKGTQSPWDFAAFSESVAEEHARRRTTSIDDKISKARQQLAVPLTYSSDDEEAGSSDVESDRQEEYRHEDDDDDDDATTVDEPKSFFASSEGTSFHANSFMDLNLSRPLLRACEVLGYTKPTPIQAACIPLALGGRDICGSAITGSGKTAAFALPTLERLLFRPKRVHAIRVLILTPTRELAVQVHSMIEKLAQFTDIRCCLIVGGLSTKVQVAALRSMPDIVVATPGRMIDHLRNSMSVDLDDLAVMILDEADRLLELGFSAEIQELVRLCPKRRQTMLFSATMTEEVNELIKLSLSKPLRLSADPTAKRPSTLTEEVVRIRRISEGNQESVLLALCSKTFTSKVIIFSGTKQAAHRLKILFGLAGFKAAELHGNLTQAQRLDALELFRKQEVDFLIATDVAARGLDIVGVQTVINFACPRDLTSYVHRVGRTARAGRVGYAVTFVTDNDRSLLKAIAKRVGSKLKSRIVAEQSITKWAQIIDQMEDQVAEVLQDEREEMAIRKAEMQVTKAENMITHREEIFSRPKRTWFVTEKQKNLLAKETKATSENGNRTGNDMMSAQQAEDLKMKEKRKREREKNMPRRQRRKLQAAREMLEDEEETKPVGKGKGKKEEEKAGLSLVDLGYRRAKAVKAVKRAKDAGKFVEKKAPNKGKRPAGQRNQSRTEEMKDLFQTDMSDRKVKKGGSSGLTKKSKSSFKSKSRYKRR
ncbi:DEAD-box ATP-dependent RNA helicase 28, partial [Linum grandiflorum]